MLVATGLTVVGGAAPAAAAAPLACVNTLYFSNGAAGNVGQLDLTTGATAPAPVFATPAGAGTSTNQLGIGAGGAIAITGTTTSLVEYEPGASADGTVTFAPKTAGVAQGTMGAINPATGLYYYGGYSGSVVNLFVFDPATNSAPAGPVVSITTPNPPGGNGDIAFDKTGRLYLVSGSATQAALYAADGTVPSSGTGTTLTSRELSRGATTVATNGIAFGSDGFLYLGGSTVLQKTNPITGAPTGTSFTLSGATSTDLGSCANPSTTETVASFGGPRAQPTDQVRVVLEGGSYGGDGTGPDFPDSDSAPDGSGDPSEPGLILPGETYTMRQEALGTTDLDDYTTTWSCTDAAGAVIASGTGNAATFTAPTGTGANVVCAFVNELPPPVAVDDTGVGVFGAPVSLAGATNDRPGTGAILAGQTVFTDPAATRGGKELFTDDGIWTIGADGTITFTPLNGFSGDAAVEYRIIDDNGQTSTATATATVRPGPSAAPDSATTTQGASVQIPVLRNDVAGQNADGTPGTIPPDSVGFAVPDQPDDAIIGDDGLSIEVPGEGVYTVDPATGIVTFAPDPTFTGTATPIRYLFADSNGNPEVSTIEVSVAPVNPTAVDDAAVTPFETPVTIDVVGNDLAGPGGAIVPTSTVFTDPAATDGGKSLVTPEGSWRVTGDGRVEFTPADGFTGTASTPYRITDANGQQSSATVSVTVRPGPTAAPDRATTPQNVDVTVPILRNDVPGTAADGSAGSFDSDSVRFRVTPGLPDGSAISDGGRVLTVPGEGVYTFDPATEAVTFDPEPAFRGPATPVTYTVTDASGNDASTTVAITVTPVTPTAIGDAAKTPGSTPVVIDILANDEPGAPSSQLVPDSVVFTSADATNGGKTLVVPGEGTWTVRDDGSARFAPVPGFEGPATPATYSVEDENGTATTAQIAVTVGGGAIAAPDAAVTLQNTPVDLDVLPNDFASDLGSPCDPGETNVPAGCDTGVFDPASVVFPASGQPVGAVVSNDGRTITVPAEGVYTVDPATGVVTFVPEPAFTGVAAPIVYSATDSHGATVSSTITVTVTGVTPEAQDDSADTASGVPVTLDLLDDDNAGDASAPLVPAATVFPTAGQPTGVTVSADGRTLTIDGQGTYVLDSAGSAVFTPVAGFSGTTTAVTYRITDANGTTDDARVQVTVRPGPSATPDAESTLQGVPVTLRPFGNDTPSRNADDSAGAWDPTSLRFPASGQPAGAQALDGGSRLVVPGEGVYTAAADGSVTFAPEPAFTGVASAVSYTGVDDIGNSITSTITIDVTAVRPAATDDAATTAFATAVTFDFAGNDDEGDPAVPLDLASAVFEPTGIPAGLTAEIRDGGKTLDIAGEGVFTLRDDGTVTFEPATGFDGTTTPVRYTIRDENGSSATAALRVTVRPGPVASPDVERTPQNVPVTVDLLGNDRPGQRADGTDGELDPTSVEFTAAGQPAGSTVGDGGKTLEVPGEGVYEIAADGRVTFTPEPSFRGAATAVAYAVTDSLGNVAASTLTVTVAGVDPIARNNAASTAPAVPVVIDVLGDDSSGTSGAALDPSTLRIVGANGALVTELTVPGEGVWTVVDGKIVFTPSAGFAGRTTPITYSVADANGTRVTATVTVTVAAGAAAGPNLPTTGGALPWAPLGTGLLLLLAGVVMLILRRRAARTRE